MASSVPALHSPLSRRLCRSSPTGSSPRPPRGVLLSPSSFSGRAFSPFGLRGMFPPSERRRMSAMSVSEEAIAPEGGGEVEMDTLLDQPVAVPVSPADVLTMFFKAEGRMDELALSNVAKALEEVEGVTDLKVQVIEGIASVELTKQTTIQATGVASNLVEIIQGTGFKLQTLNLSFEDEEDEAG